jgi:hypothetical protein
MQPKLKLSADDIVFLTNIAVKLSMRFDLKPKLADDYLFCTYICDHLLDYIQFLHDQKCEDT